MTPRPRYSLRTLLILLAIGPPLLAGVWLTLPDIQGRYLLWQLDRQQAAQRKAMRAYHKQLNEQATQVQPAKSNP